MQIRIFHIVWGAFLSLLMATSVYAQPNHNQNVCTVIGDPTQRMDVLFPSWHIVEGQTWDPPTLSESGAVTIYGNAFYLYKDFLSIRGENVNAMLTAYREKVPLDYLGKLRNLSMEIEEGISFNRKENDFRQDENNLKKLEADSYARLVNGQHRDVNLVQHEGVWYYLIFYKRNGSEGDIDQGNLFNVYVLKPDYSIDYICTGEAK